MFNITYQKWIYISRSLLLIFIFLTFFNFWYVNRERDYDEHYLIHTTNLEVISQRVAKHAEEVIATGNKDAIEHLKLNSENFTFNLNILKNGITDKDDKLPPSPEFIQKNEIKALSDKWDQLKPQVDIILLYSDSIEKARELSIKYSKRLDKVIENGRLILLALIKRNPPDLYDKAKALLDLERQVTQLRFILKDTLDVNSFNPLDIALPDEFNNFENAITNFARQNPEPELTSYFSEISADLQAVKVNIDTVIIVGKTLDDIFKAKEIIFNNSIPFLNLTTALEAAYRLNAAERKINEFTAYTLSVLTFLIMLAWSYFMYKANKQSLQETEARNKQVQTEIHALLEELTDLAKGDLTIQVGVEGEVTQKIARAINYSVTALRHVVININKTTQETSKVAEQAEKLVKDLAIESEHQAQEISETTNSVHAMVASIEKVSFNSSQSETVALESVKIANEGGKVVRNTISGMERIQLQIVDTSEKIRRLSESSQEIGEIVSLINGIAEQTNILSLNASIQAAMAGEAGRGFAVVADEVQQLAGKASYATKEIDSLVKSIQTDTQQVISAMEQTRTEVLQGVSLAQNAGETLGKIEEVSHNLSQLVKDISISAREQAIMSNKISSMMNVIRDIANNTASGTLNTASFIAKLTQLVTDLRHSVSEFKLPKKKNESK